MTVARALDWAEKQLGTTEHPPNSNHVVFWDQYREVTGSPAFHGSPWCGAFGILVDHHSGTWTSPPSWIGVFAIQSWGEAHDRFHRGTAGVRAGDALIIGGPGVHTGRALGPAHADGSVPTIEGNTSPGLEGSQFNGGTVARKVRQAHEIYGYVRIHDLLGGGSAPKAAKGVDDRSVEPQYRPEKRSGPLHLWETGPRVELLQHALGVEVDGYFGPATRKAVAAFRAAHREAGPGPDTDVPPALLDLLVKRPAPPAAVPHSLQRGSKGGLVRKLQRRLNATLPLQLDVDGDFGEMTESAVDQIKAAHHWPTDGIAGPRVWTVLLGDATSTIPGQRETARPRHPTH